MSLPDNLSDLITFNTQTSRVTSREGKHCEFKQSFEPSKLPKYLKSLSAFANADGGKIIFGISDSPREIVGIETADLLDDADITNVLLEYFDPEISFQTKEYRVDGKTLFVLATDCSPRRPIICKRGKNISVESRGKLKTIELLAEGAIYYRYSAKSDRVKYSELQDIISDREHKKIQSIIETLKLAEKIGFNKIGFVDAKDFGKEGKTSELFITEETARSLNFVDEGRFVEKSDNGAPAYYVMGKINLQQVVVGPLPDEDKNLPNEVADIIRPDIQTRFGDHVRISSTQVGKILERFDLKEMPFSQEDSKLRRRYITRDGISAIRLAMHEQPLEFLKSFSSKLNIAIFEESG